MQREVCDVLLTRKARKRTISVERACLGLNVGKEYIYTHVNIEKYSEISSWLSLGGRLLFSFSVF